MKENILGFTVKMTGVGLNDVLCALRYANSGCANVMDGSVVRFEMDHLLMDIFTPDKPAIPPPYHDGVGQNILAVSVFGVKKVRCLKTGHDKWFVEGVALVSPGVVWKVSITSFLLKNTEATAEILLHERCRADAWAIPSV